MAQTGVVKFFNGERGYGFIKPDDGGRDVFVHITAVEQAGLKGLDGVSVAVFADYDNDGHKDIFVSRTFEHNQLFHNNGDGTFTDVTANSGIGGLVCHSAL